MAIGGLKRGDVACPQFADIGKTAAAPAEDRAVQLLDQQIRHQTCMAAVAVRKRMDRHQPMVKSDSDLVGRIGVMLDPITNVIEQDGEVGRDAIGGDADVAFGLAVGAGPPQTSPNMRP